MSLNSYDRYRKNFMEEHKEEIDALRAKYIKAGIPIPSDHWEISPTLDEWLAELRANAPKE